MSLKSEQTKAYLESYDIENLEKAATNMRDKLLIRLLFHLGCRISEALSLAVEDVDFTEGTVIIQHLKAKIKLSCPQCGAALGKRHSFCPKCGARVKEVVAREQEHRRVPVPHVPLREEVDVHLTPDVERGALEVRIWWDNRKVQSLTYPLREFPRVHF